MRGEQAMICKAQYLYGRRGRRSDRHKREGECAIPGEICRSALGATDIERCRDGSAEVSRGHSRSIDRTRRAEHEARGQELESRWRMETQASGLRCRTRPESSGRKPRGHGAGCVKPHGKERAHQTGGRMRLMEAVVERENMLGASPSGSEQGRAGSRWPDGRRPAGPTSGSTGRASRKNCWPADTSRRRCARWRYPSRAAGNATIGHSDGGGSTDPAGAASGAASRCSTRTSPNQATAFDRDAALTRRCEAARSYVAEGRRWVVDIDLEKFFDRVNHDVLMSRVARKVKDKRVLQSDPPLPAGGNDGRRSGDARERKGRRKAGRSRRCCPTSCSTIWTRNWKDAGIGSAATPTTATSMSEAQRRGERVMESITRFLGKRLAADGQSDKSAVDATVEAQVPGLHRDRRTTSRS